MASGPVRAPVVYHDDLVRDVIQPQLQMQMLHGDAMQFSSSRAGITTDSSFRSDCPEAWLILRTM